MDDDAAGMANGGDPGVLRWSSPPPGRQEIILGRSDLLAAMERAGPDILTQSSLLAAMARAEYEAMTPAERDEVDAAWAAVPEWRKQDIRDEIEFDLL